MAEALLQAASPSLDEEPILEIDDIQGNILLGFNKDFEETLFLEIVDKRAFLAWLQIVAARVTTTRQVLLYRQALRRFRSGEAAEPPANVTWLQVGFSHRGLGKLIAPAELAQFKDGSFVCGLAGRSQDLGDPPETVQRWVIGGRGNEADVVIVVAADAEPDLDREVLALAVTDPANGCRLLHNDRGARLPARDREHFGFRDGISQPGIRGRLSADPNDLLTPRENPQRPHEEGKPGQTLVWPGEFVFGYSGQDANATAAEGGVGKAGLDSLQGEDGPMAPAWAINGSYLVFRRLLQGVGAFRRWVRDPVNQRGLSSEVLEAKLVGRFRSGAPISRAAVDDPAMGAEDRANNDFRYATDSPAIGPLIDEQGVVHEWPPAAADSEGDRCPFAAHIRKAYPRNDVTRFGTEPRTGTETHRILRRAIPFGPAYPEPEPEGFVDDQERGLLFLAYQTSIVGQFEHIHIAWANTLEDRRPFGYPFSAGFDPIIGQDRGQPRQFLLTPPRLGGIPADEILQAEPWVVPSGGGYFFIPSIAALGMIFRGEL